MKNTLALTFSIITRNSRGVEEVTPIIKGKEKRFESNLSDIIMRFEFNQELSSLWDESFTSYPGTRVTSYEFVFVKLRKVEIETLISEN